MNSHHFIIAGGGTGGHLFPGIALANYIKKECPKSKILFIGTQKGIESRLIPEKGYPIKYIDISGIKGTGIKRQFKNIFKIPSSIFQSIKIIKNFNPDAIIGLGGYASGPAVIGGWIENIPTFIMEQNSVPGVTNRILSRFVNNVFTTFKYSHKYFPKSKILHTGNPIREDIENVNKKDHDKEQFNILIFGGSQGSKKINETVVEVVKKFPNINFTHQTGKLTYDTTKALYNKFSPKNLNLTTFIDDMGDVYSKSDIVICRAGATSISELQAAKKCSILIPYPYATDNHQVLNGKELVENGAAIMIEEKDLTPKVLIDKIEELYNNFEKIESFENNIEKTYKTDTKEIILKKIFEYYS